MGDVEIKETFCAWCKAECGLLAHVEDAKLLKLEPDPNWFRKVWPPPKGCVRRKAAVEWFYHPMRFKFPLKRRGERGEGKWERIDWDQALDEIAEKLGKLKNTYGPETVATTRGTLRTHEEYRSRFMNLFGSPNQLGHSRICMGPRSVMGDIIAGKFSNYSIRESTNCVVLLGAEPLVSRPWVAYRMREIKKKGAKLIVIDPRRTRSAEMADVWLPLRPGTDAALLLGMIYVIINEDLYDSQFVKDWCYGFDKLRERIKEYSPEKVAKITNLPIEKIQEAARLYAKNRPGTFIEGMGVEHLYNVCQALHARWILAGLVNNIDIEGGEEQASSSEIIGNREIEMAEAMAPEQWRKELGTDRFSIFSYDVQKMVIDAQTKAFGKAGGSWYLTCQGFTPAGIRAAITGKPYPIKAIITQAGNPMVTLANTKLIYKALKNLDLYVVMDYFPTPSSAIADYILPAASWLERPEIWTFIDYSPFVLIRRAAVPHIVLGEYDRRRDYDLWRGLGIRLGQGKYWPWETLEDSINYRLSPIGLTLETAPRVYTKKREFEKYKRNNYGFGTPTGKIEFYSTILEKQGYDPLPKHVEPPETQVSNPEMAKKYPYTLITGGRIREFFHSEWRQIDSVRKRHPHPIVQIHPFNAKEMDLEDEDWVWIETLRGRVKMKVQIFDGIQPNVVHAEHGWYLPELPEEEPWLHGAWESNINVDMNDDPEVCNPEIGTWPLRTALCKVYKVKSY